MLHRLLIAAGLAAAMPAFGGEQLFTGQVEKIVVRAAGVDGCPPACSSSGPDQHGKSRVCVSNAGGCQRTDIKVDKVFLGDVRPGGTITVESRTGEWGGTTFPETQGQILVHLDQNSHAWTQTVTRDGKTFASARRPFSVAGVSLQSLPADADGMVSLDQLLERIGSR